MAQRPVRVTIVGINFAPEPTGIAPYTTSLATALASRGHNILVLTGHPHYPYWKRAEGSWQFRSEEDIDGVRVRRLRHRIPQQLSWVARAAMEISFGLQVISTGWRRPDVVICITPPLLAIAMTMVRARATFRRPAVGIVVQDLYATGIAETGAASGLTAHAVRLVESVTMRLADGISVIHAGFAKSVVEQLDVAPERIREIRNWNHVGQPDESASEAFRIAHGWAADEVVILHAGNLGYKQGLENVLAAARLADRGSRRVRFVLLGDGNRRESLQAAAAGISSVDFLAPVDDDQFPAALGAADILLVNELPGVAQMSVPSKLTSYFNAGRPILAAVDAAGFTATELSASGAGLSVPADRPDLLLSEAIRLADDQELSKQLSEAGRRYCEKLLTQEAALDRYERWVIDLADLRRTGSESDS